MNTNRLRQILLLLLMADVAYRLMLRERVRRLIHGPKHAPFSTNTSPLLRQMNRQMYRRLVAARAARQ